MCCNSQIKSTFVKRWYNLKSSITKKKLKKRIHPCEADTSANTTVIELRIERSQDYHRKIILNAGVHYFCRYVRFGGTRTY